MAARIILGIVAGLVLALSLALGSAATWLWSSFVAADGAVRDLGAIESTAPVVVVDVAAVSATVPFAIPGRIELAIDADQPVSVFAGPTAEIDRRVFATGYDAITGPYLRMDIRGRDGLALKDKWAAGPKTWLGLMLHGFPNLFTITGPGSPSVLGNVPVAIEQHVEWISDCIAYLGQHGVHGIEATRPAEDAWVDHVNDVAGMTLYPRCNSWYLGANVPGKPRIFMPYIGVPPYVAKCREVASRGYEGFALVA